MRIFNSPWVIGWDPPAPQEADKEKGPKVRQLLKEGKDFNEDPQVQGLEAFFFFCVNKLR